MSRKYAEKFLEQAHKNLGDVDEPLGGYIFSVRLPRSIEPQFLDDSDGKVNKKTALLRQIVVRAIAEMPEWVAAIEEDLKAKVPS